MLGFLGDSSNSLNVYDKGIRGLVFKNEVPASPTVDDYYFVQKGKIIKSEDGGAGKIAIYES